MATGVSQTSRRAWKNELDQAARALASRDLETVMQTARELDATLVSFRGRSPTALYHDANFSLLRVE